MGEGRYIQHQPRDSRVSATGRPKKGSEKGERASCTPFGWDAQHFLQRLVRRACVGVEGLRTLISVLLVGARRPLSEPINGDDGPIPGSFYRFPFLELPDD